jgi:DNA-directed RNA polymerase subunit RPC12/RpoP
MISFVCPKCEATLEIDTTAAGMEVACPSCNERIIVPKTEADSDTAPLPTAVDPVASIISCPQCQGTMSLPLQLESHAVAYPHCSHTFVFNPIGQTPEQGEGPSENQPLPVPEKLPFLKASRRRLLDEQVKHLAADGELSPNDERHLVYMVAQFGLTETELRHLCRTLSSRN